MAAFIFVNCDCNPYLPLLTPRVESKLLFRLRFQERAVETLIESRRRRIGNTQRPVRVDQRRYHRPAGESGRRNNLERSAHWPLESELKGSVRLSPGAAQRYVHHLDAERHLSGRAVKPIDRNPVGFA